MKIILKTEAKGHRHILAGRLLTRACHGPSQSESNFINTVIKQEGNYFKYWKNVRVTHEFCGYHILFDTQWINDAKEIYSEIMVPRRQPLPRTPELREGGGQAAGRPEGSGSPCGEQGRGGEGGVASARGVHTTAL